jgi:hypothetical protein
MVMQKVLSVPTATALTLLLWNMVFHVDFAPAIGLSVPAAPQHLALTL